jgi:hypothetical protein
MMGEIENGFVIPLLTRQCGGVGTFGEFCSGLFTQGLRKNLIVIIQKKRKMS